MRLRAAAAIARARAGHVQRRMHAHAVWPRVRAGTGGQRMRRISLLPSHRLRRAQRLVVRYVTEVFVDVICSTISRMRWIARPVRMARLTDGDAHRSGGTVSPFTKLERPSAAR